MELPATFFVKILAGKEMAGQKEWLAQSGSDVISLGGVMQYFAEFASLVSLSFTV